MYAFLGNYDDRDVYDPRRSARFWPDANGGEAIQNCSRPF